MTIKTVKILSIVAAGVIGVSMLGFFTPVFAEQETTNASGSIQADATSGDDSSASGGGLGSAPSINACDSLKDKVAREAAGCDSNASKNQIANIVVNVLNAIIAISGLVAVVFIVVGGVGYMTSTGDPARIKKAKDTILYACVGLVVCVLAFAIVNWTISAIKGPGDSSNTSEESSEESE